MNRRFTFLIVLILTLSGFFGCTQKQNTGDPVTDNGIFSFTDELGSLIEVENPQRVIALLGSFGEIWTLAGGALTGVTDDVYGERETLLSPGVSIVGKYNQPNMEQIIALKPDLVLLSSETPAHLALKDVFSNAGIPAAYFNVTHFEDYLEMLDICTSLTGKKDLYLTNGLNIQEEINETLQLRQPQTAPRILLLITYSGGIAVQNSATMTGKMLKDLGCMNIADQYPSLLKEFSLEAVIEENPDFIFVIPMGNDDEMALRHLAESIESNPAWNRLQAVINNKYILLPKEKFLYKPNVRWGESYAYLAEKLYGR